MGEGTDSLGPPPEQLELEVERIRNNMTQIVSELDHRRHEAFDWRAQVKRHAMTLGIVAGSVALLLGAAMTVGMVRRSRRRRPLVKIGELGEALARMIDHPQEVARPKPNLVKQTMGSAASTAAGILVKMVLRRMAEQSVR